MADANTPIPPAVGESPKNPLGKITDILKTKRGLVLAVLALAAIGLVVYVANSDKKKTEDTDKTQTNQQNQPSPGELSTSVVLDNATDFNWENVVLTVEGSDQVRLSVDAERDKTGIKEGQQKAVFKIGDIKKGTKKGITVYIKSSVKGKQNFLISAKTAGGLLVLFPQTKTLTFN